MIARILLLCLFVLSLVVQPTAAAPDTDKNDWLCIPFTCVGPITPTTTAEDLIRLFGAANVQRKTLFVAEGTESRDVSIIFPGTKEELILFWRDNRYGSTPLSASIRRQGASWLTLHNIRIGTSLERLNQINGRPFWINGFGWDYGGYVRWDWNGGNLFQAKGLAVRLRSLHTLPRDFYGDGVTLFSTNPALLPDAVVVSSIDIDLVRPAGVSWQDVLSYLIAVVPEVDALYKQHPNAIMFVESTPDPAKLEYYNYYHVYIGLNMKTHRTVWARFAVDQSLSTVLWIDPVQGRLASLEKWRQSRKGQYTNKSLR